MVRQTNPLTLGDATSVLGEYEDATLVTLDAPEYGAHHMYGLFDKDGVLIATLVYQKGGVNKVGTNGFQHLFVLLTLLHRVQSFLANFGDTDGWNTAFRSGIKTAIEADLGRTKARSDAGVEGNHEVPDHGNVGLRKLLPFNLPEWAIPAWKN